MERKLIGVTIGYKKGTKKQRINWARNKSILTNAVTKKKEKASEVGLVT